jgi:hypothetical protein
MSFSSSAPRPRAPPSPSCTRPPPSWTTAPASSKPRSRARDRFLAYELHDEWFAGGRLSRAHWREFILAAPGLESFRHAMFSRLVPNPREIGLLRPRVLPRYEQVGLLKYFGGASADRLSAEATRLAEDIHTLLRRELG